MSEINPFSAEVGLRAFRNAKSGTPDDWFLAGLSAYLASEKKISDQNDALGLTRRMHQLMVFIQNHFDEHQYYPSFDEMCTALSCCSKGNIHRYIAALEDRGYIHREPHRARAMRIIKRVTPTNGKGLE